MHSPAASTSTLPALDNHDIDKISAYYSLAFPNFTYYLQTLTVTIGRRPIPSSGSSLDASSVDVDLGPLKSVSRLHARIEYEEEEERFVLVVLGRNGAWVDGIWAGSGSKVPLGARSQIQIATRTFHFVLPPPPAPESASPSSPPSTARQRSPSVDITSLSPSSSHPASPSSKAPATSIPDNPISTTITKPAKPSKKRKRPEADLPLPENMPPKPSATYAVMCYRAITSLGGKATLQEVVQWMIDNYEWYRLNVGGPWENSIRHNLSSNRSFRNATRSPEERGKGFLWAIDPQFETALQEQDAKARLAEQSQQQKSSAGLASAQPSLPRNDSQSPSHTKDSRVKLTNGKKEKNVADLPPAFTRSPKTLNGIISPPTGVTQTSAAAAAATTSNTSTVPSTSTHNNTEASSSSTSNVPQIPPNVILPIVVGPLPDSHPTASATAAALAASSSSTSAVLTAPPIVLHNGTLILNPTIFSHLTPSQLKELEGLGAQKALEILQSYIVRFLKESKKLEGAGRSKGRIRGRGRGRGGVTVRGGKGRPTPEASHDGTNNTLTQAGEGQTGTSKVDHHSTETCGTKSSSTTLAGHSINQTTKVTAETMTQAEGPVSKKRKLDNAEDLTVIGNGEVEVDVVGT